MINGLHCKFYWQRPTAQESGIQNNAGNYAKWGPFLKIDFYLHRYNFLVPVKRNLLVIFGITLFSQSILNLFV